MFKQNLKNLYQSNHTVFASFLQHYKKNVLFVSSEELNLSNIFFYTNSCIYMCGMCTCFSSKSSV